MRFLAVTLAASALLLTACPGEEKPSLNEQRKELVDKVGGAPKTTIDNAAKATAKHLEKGVDKINKAVDEAAKDAEGGW